VQETDKTRFSTCGSQLKARSEKCDVKVQEGKQFDKLNKLKNEV